MSVHAAAHAAAKQKAQEDLLGRLRTAHAVDPAHSAALDDVGALGTRVLQHLVDAGVVRRSGERRYYLDEHRLTEWRARQRQQVRMVLLALIVAAICALVVVGLVILTS